MHNSSNPYEVDIGLQHAPRTGMTFGEILGGIVFGTIAAATVFVATYLSGLFLLTSVVRLFGIGVKEEGLAALLLVPTLACVVSVVTFIKVFRGARNSQRYRPAADQVLQNSGESLSAKTEVLEK